jgi:hypothetical protein
MNIEAPKNRNYCATVIEINNLVPLPNCDNVQAAIVFGNSVIVSKDVKKGDVGLFFPVETALSSEFLSANNLYRKPEFGNVDPEKKGFFEQSGRVKAMKFRGNKSEGFWIPLNSLEYLGIGLSDLAVGIEFDVLNGKDICKKYIPRGQRRSGGQNAARAKMPKLENQIVEGQFKFHFDTEQLRKNVHKILPTDWISISDKWHGTSAIVANVLVNRKLSIVERIAQLFGITVQHTEYGLTYSSRRVVKGITGEAKKTAQHFYSEDIWGVVCKEIEQLIPKGFTVYGEIVGYTKDGGAIQAGYHYGCPHKEHRFLVYRVTVTNADGVTIELTWPQMKQFCEKFGLEMVKEFYYGQAGNLFRDIEFTDIREWQQAFLEKLTATYVNDQMCPHNNNEVPAEGVVVRVDHLNECESFKLKNFKFLEWETKQLDQGVVDIETAESETTEVAVA